MKKHLLIVALISSIQLLGQDNLLFDTAKVDANTKLIGRYPHYDKEKTYRLWNFYIDDPIEIRNKLKELALGEEVGISSEYPSFTISIVQNNIEVRSWTINPISKTALYNGRTYKFDIEKVKRLSHSYPFDYRFDKVVFSTKDEYEKFLAVQKN